MGKRIRTLILTLVLLVALPAAALAAAGGDKGGTVTVTGHAELTVVPDIAYITAGIVTTGADVESARRENERAMRRIIDAVTALGIDKNNVKTAQFSLQPVYKNDSKDGTAGAIGGYRLVNSLTVAIEDLEKIGPVIDAAFQAGANQFQGLRFAVKNDGKLRDELLRLAVQDGRHKAAVMAEALGLTLGPPQAVTEAGRYSPVQADNYRSLKAVANGTPIEAGTLTVGMDVNLTFGI